MYVHGVICIRSYIPKKLLDVYGLCSTCYSTEFSIHCCSWMGLGFGLKRGGILWLVTLKAAFGSDGQLLGVVGIDVYIDELGNIAQLVRDALENQTNQGNIQPAIVTLNNLNCSLAVSPINCTLAL